MSRSQLCMVIGIAQRSRGLCRLKSDLQVGAGEGCMLGPMVCVAEDGDRGVRGSLSNRQASSQASLLSGLDSWSPEHRETLGPVVPPSCPGPQQCLWKR